MGSVLSCRTVMFASAEEAFRYFPEAGIRCAEVPPPGDGDYAALAALAARHGVRITTFATGVAVDDPASVAGLKDVLTGAASVGVEHVFVSVKASEETPFADAVAGLRDLAATAVALGTLICMETHPPFGANAAAARRTIEAVDSPGLRFNFDTANVYYYNEGVDSVSQLEAVVDLVASLHIKDTDGGYRSANFPEVGTGVVDFAGVFGLLAEAGFTGPCALEVEGGHVAGVDAAGRLAFLKRCVAHLDDIGALA